jgi:predicted RNase H-like nuclease (RuvC/YqgF family)
MSEPFINCILTQKEQLAASEQEIERLRAENSKLKSTDMAVAMTEMSLRDEIERLRARVKVLEAILNAIFPDGANIKLVPKANAEEAKP